MSHLDLDPYEYDTHAKVRKRKLERWYRNLSLEDKKRFDRFVATLKLVIADLKDEKRR
jgi:hypothetical protein